MLTTRCLENELYCRVQRMVVKGSKSNWQMVMRGVPHGSVMSLIVLNIFKTDLNDGVGCTLTKFAEGEEVAAPEERATTERPQWAGKLGQQELHEY